jgi:hypothetical protein
LLIANGVVPMIKKYKNLTVKTVDDEDLILYRNVFLPQNNKK